MSKHFSLREYDPHDDRPWEQHVDVWEKGLELCLEPIRERYGKWIRITSGYRSPAQNKAANGAKQSLHMGQYDGHPACAFDFEDYGTGGIEELWPLCLEMVRNHEIPAFNLIEERGKIHIGYVDGIEPRYLILKQRRNADGTFALDENGHFIYDQYDPPSA